ncbi:MAG: M20 family metallopeptidase [Cyanobacteriota bacterium]|nr:M20 family metallopeptidase [Cyanobacteriota bacterium]
MFAADLRPAVQLLQPDLVTWRRRIHQYPELGFGERQTAAYICKLLDHWGVSYRAGIAQTGIVALIEGGSPGRTLALRADMDALPIQEMNEVSYRSQHEHVMHACGHDGHTAIALGTVKLLQEQRMQLSGSVKVIFQPAEEKPGGAKPMIAAGVLRDPDVEAMIGLHLWNNLPLGSVGVKSGPSMAFADHFTLTLYGRGGHGAMPHQTIDTIVLGSQVVMALQTIVSRNVNPLLPAVLSVGSFKAGDVFNVIAPTAELKGTVRTFDAEVAELMPRRIEEVVAGLCQAHAATFELDYQRHYPAVVNDPTIAALVKTVAEQVLGSPSVIHPEMTMGGEDISFFLEKVPGCYFFLGSANAAKGLDFPHHHPRFDFDETALGLGVEIFLRCVETYLGQGRERSTHPANAS